MASVDRIDSIYDIPALTAQQKAAADLVNKTIEQIKAAKAQSIDFNVNTKTLSDYSTKIEQLDAKLKSMSQASTAAATAQVQFNQALQLSNNSLQQNIELRNRLQNTLNSYKASLKEDFALLKNGTISQAEYRKRVLETTVAIEKYNAKISEVNKEIKASFPTQKQLEAELKRQQKAADDAGNEYKQLSAAYNEAALKAKNYQLTLGKTHPTSIQATADAQRLGAQLKELDASVGQNQRNVGNYPSAFSKIGTAFNKALTPIRTLANILPGLGLSGIFLAGGTAIASFIKYLVSLNSELNNTAKFTKIRNDVQQESIKTSAKEIVTIDGLVAVARNENASRQDRNLAIKQLQDTYPAYLKNISLETINSEAAAEAINALRDAVLQKAVADAYAERIATAVIKQAEIKQKIDEEEIKDLNDAIAFRNKLNEARRTGDKASESALLRYGRLTDLTEKRIHDYNGELKSTNDELEFLKRNYNAALEASLKFTTKQDKTKQKKEKDLVEADRKARFEILKAQLELDKEFDLRRANDQKRSYVDRLFNLIQYGEDSKRLIEAQAAFDLGNAKLTKDERIKIENDKNNALIRLAAEVGDKLKAITAENFKTNTEQLAKEISGAIPKELQKILDDFQKKQKEAIDKAAKDAKELKKLIKDNLVSLASELEGLFFDIFTNQIERQKNAVQDNIDLLEAQKQKDIEVENSRVQSVADREDAISKIEARAAAKKQQLELKQRQLDQQKARFEKARAVTEIVQNTSIAVVKALAQFPGPVGIGLAAVIGALGAVQIARVLAQPIPRYAEGTDNHPGGPAIVGDGGKSEAVQLPDGSVYKTPAVDTLVNLPKGSKVFPDYAKAVVHNHNAEVIDTRAELKAGFSQVVNAVKRIPQPIIRADRAWTQAMKQGSSFRNFINRSI